MSVILNETQLKRGLVNWNTGQKQYPGLNTELRTKAVCTEQSTGDIRYLVTGPTHVAATGLLKKVKQESEKAGLKLNIQKTKIMTSSPKTSWQIDRETMKTVQFSSIRSLSRV